MRRIWSCCRPSGRTSDGDDGFEIETVHIDENVHAKVIKAHTAVQFILEDLELLLAHESAAVIRKRNQIVLSLHEDLKLIRSFIENLQENSNRQSALSDLVNDIFLVVDELLDAIDSYIQRTDRISDFHCFFEHSAKIVDLIREIKLLGEGIVHVQFDRRSSGGGNFIRESSSSQGLEEQIVVGFENEATELLERLIGEQKQLEVIPIIGMGGIGKTTLANRMYNDSSIIRHFHIRAWTSVSQLYQKRNFLNNILSSILSNRDPIFSMSDEDMGQKLYRCLKGNKYLIVIDDVWDVGVWDDLKMYFPDDHNCSRILMTSRNGDVASEITPERPPYFLRFLTQEESWDLFRRKSFADAKCPEQLTEIGKKIVANCKGLPLAIVVIAGVLAKEDRTEECWTHVAENSRLSVNNEVEHIMDILSLSYKYLPSLLKSCFLYFGSFPVDYEFPVKWLMRSWIAEGFIQPTVGKRLEDTAEEYLMNLISRSLVIVAKTRSDGGIKSCHIHDLLRDLCRKKSKEKKFVQLLCNCRSTATPDYSPTFYDCQYHHFYNSHYVDDNEVFNSGTLTVYKFLTVLELRHLVLDNFPKQIFHLLHLKYLALQLGSIENLPPSVFKLWNLETFIIDAEKGGRVELTGDILKMIRIRHFRISKELFCDPCKWNNSEESFIPESSLDSLQTISQLCPLGSVNTLLSRTPNLRKVGFHLTYSESNKSLFFPNLLHLSHLETLKFEYQTLGMVPFSICHLQDFFRTSLKKLTLVGSHVDWTEMSSIAMLPNLEVLKIEDNFFSGPLWETSEDGFRCLRFLKLSHMNLQEWISSSSHFPRLEHLVLNGCLELKQIPSDFGDIVTLATMKVYRSSESAVESARQIQETQDSWGNSDFKLFIIQDFQEYWSGH